MHRLLIGHWERSRVAANCTWDWRGDERVQAEVIAVVPGEEESRRIPWDRGRLVTGGLGARRASWPGFRWSCRDRDPLGAARV